MGCLMELEKFNGYPRNYLSCLPLGLLCLIDALDAFQILDPPTGQSKPYFLFYLDTM
jgi:hypothetical protein